jgi:hypothetical protein
MLPNHIIFVEALVYNYFISKQNPPGKTLVAQHKERTKDQSWSLIDNMLRLLQSKYGHSQGKIQRGKKDHDKTFSATWLVLNLGEFLGSKHDNKRVSRLLGSLQ